MNNNIEINRRIITEMLFALHAKEAFQLNTREEEKLFDTMGATYPMEVTTASISFDDSMSFTHYGNYMVDMIKEWASLEARKEDMTKEQYEEAFAKWQGSILERADDLDRMEAIKKKNAMKKKEPSLHDKLLDLYSYVD